MKIRFLVLYLSVFVLLAIARADEEAPPDFYASFQDTATAMDARKNPIQPEVARDLRFVDGVQGRAVYLGDASSLLRYPSGSLLNPAGGTIMFWVQPGWDGSGPASSQTSYRFLNAGAGFDVSMPGHELRWQAGEKLFRDIRRPGWLKGDWHHIALRWESPGWTKLYVNGLPYANWYVNRQVEKTETLDFGNPRSFALGPALLGEKVAGFRTNAAFGELKIYRRPLSDDEIMADYRRFAPLDMVMERHFLRAGESERVVLDVWPGGQMVRPPAGKPVATPVRATADLQIIAESDGTVMGQRHFDLDLAGHQSLEVPVADLPEGSYRLVCRVNRDGRRHQSSFRFFTYRQQAGPVASDEGLKLGEPIVDIDCTKLEPGVSDGGSTLVSSSTAGSYREAVAEKNKRFAYPLDFSAAAPFTGAPMLLEIEWPDDKPRSMGFYLYKESKAELDRDRLQGGIQSGNEFSLSGKTQRSSYLIYPWTAKYLLELRTMAKGYPAAISRIIVRPVIGRLPKLALKTPEGLPTRHLGHFDEDQTWDYLLATDMPDALPEEKAVRNLEMALDYLDYTGQDMMSNHFMRYRVALYELPGTPIRYGGASIPGWRDLMLDMFERRGKKISMDLDIMTLPDGFIRPDRQEELLAGHYFRLDRSGKPVPAWGGFNKANPLHPLYRASFLGHIDELMRRFGSHPALNGVALWPGDWQMGDLSTGYDDLTVGLFEKETGHKVNAGSDSDRFGNRYAILTGSLRTEWIAWRCRKTTGFIAEIAEHIHRVNPDMPLSVFFGGGPGGGKEWNPSVEDIDFATYYREEHGLDAAGLRKIPGVVVAAYRSMNRFRWQLHWNNMFLASDELLEDFRRQSFFRDPSRVGRAYTYSSYFETFLKSLDPAYNCRFENADVKPHGRFFLRDTSQVMASVDPEVYLFGGQPLGASGRDDETREFARAFRALPAGSYRDITGLSDPVCGRFLATPQGIYLYLQNLVEGDVSVSIQAPDGVDLSTGAAVTGKAGRWEIALRPFELKAFRIPADSPEPLAGKGQVSDALRATYEAAYREIAASVSSLASLGAEASLYERRLRDLRAALDEGRFAEAHRFIFSVLFRELPAQVKNAKAGYLKVQKKMIDAGRYALACGSKDYIYPVGKEKTLFFPDQKYAPGGFGHVGSHNTGQHDISGMQDSVDRRLLATEAYEVEGYAFTVPNGNYTVRLYNRIGFEPNGAPGRVVMTLDIQGERVWERMDLFEALNRDITQALVSEFRDIKVTDGVLRLDWSPVNNVLGWVNAIEVIPQDASPSH